MIRPLLRGLFYESKVNNSQCIICFYKVYSAKSTLYQLKMLNVSNPVKAIIVSMILLITLMNAVTYHFWELIGIDIYTSNEVLFKTLLYAVVTGFFSFKFRYSIKIHNSIIFSLPIYFFCIRPILEYKENHAIGEIPMYVTHQGQGLILLSISMLACALWVYMADS
ncbi:hypothetical protein [Acinetobacter calcoaceticus]